MSLKYSKAKTLAAHRNVAEYFNETARAVTTGDMLDKEKRMQGMNRGR
jgi:hypothetical protein